MHEKQYNKIYVQACDMYPLYRTTGKEGIFMRYNYEFKRKCVEIYRQHQYPPAPSGLSGERSRKTAGEWVRIEETNGRETLRHRNSNKVRTAEEKLDPVTQVISGQSNKSAAPENGVNSGQLYRWVRQYKTLGYNDLADSKSGRPSRNPDMKKANCDRPGKLGKSEYEERVRLMAGNEYIKAEVEVIKRDRPERRKGRCGCRKERQQARIRHRSREGEAGKCYAVLQFGFTNLSAKTYTDSNFRRPVSDISLTYAEKYCYDGDSGTLIYEAGPRMNAASACAVKFRTISRMTPILW